MTFEEVCNKLELGNTPDWGIINSNSSRVSEFINFITANDMLDSRIKFEFVELIVASMNDAIIDNKANCEVYASFHNYVNHISKIKKFKPQFQYWISIKSHDEYPVGLLIEKYLKEDSHIV